MSEGTFSQSIKVLPKRKPISPSAMLSKKNAMNDVNIAVFIFL